MNKRKKITVGFIASWIFSLFFILMGLFLLINTIVFGSLVIILSLLILPPTSGLIQRKMNIKFSNGNKWLVIIVIIIVFFAGVINSAEDKVIEPTTKDIPITTKETKEEVSKVQPTNNDYNQIEELIDERNLILKKYQDSEGSYYFNALSSNDAVKYELITKSIIKKLEKYKLTAPASKKKVIEELLKEENERLEKIKETIQTWNEEVSYIKVWSKADQWDADAEKDGLLFELQVFAKEEVTIRTKGTLEVSLYHGTGLMGDQKGTFIQKWTKEYDVTDFTSGTCGGKSCAFIEDIQLEYDKDHGFGSFSVGYLEAKFISQGETFEAVQKSVLVD
ncbi:hypothetical protein HOA91_02695 [Candidatus Woesearchaeota archaeon]|nr:hypothetical protein [Candidatus Woesearchaeota archaeon]